MSDISLDALRLRERELELDAVMIRGRIEEVRTLIDIALRRRGGRPRKAAENIAIIPQRVGGGTYEPERDEEGELPEGRKRAAEIRAAAETDADTEETAA